MAVVKIPGSHSNYPYAQTSITPISFGGSKLRPQGTKLTYPYAQTSITPINNGMQQKPVSPLPLFHGGGVGGDAGYPH